MNVPCDCCDGPLAATAPLIYNRPGLRRLRYRAATHAGFYAAMQARLSSSAYPRLAVLRTRAAADPAMALLDAWASVADVLTFYQERIANEGYLRTATERRSVLELARLVGYALRPGVAATVYLAYTLDQNAEAPVVIAPGARANSIPGPGEQMQVFETAEPLEARRAWNVLLPRMSEPQTAQQIKDNGLYLKGSATRLRVNDPLLVDYADGKGPRLVRVVSLREDSAAQRTEVMLGGEVVTALQTMAASTTGTIGLLGGLIKQLTLAPSLPPASARQLERKIGSIYGAKSDTLPRLLTQMRPQLQQVLYTAWSQVPAEQSQTIKVQALRVSAQAFGHNAPLRQVGFDDSLKRPTWAEWEVGDPWNGTVPNDENVADIGEHHTPLKLFLDADYELGTENQVVIDKGDGKPFVTQVKATHRSYAGYGMAGKTVQLDLKKKWMVERESFATVRSTRVYGGGETLELADQPLKTPIKGKVIELAQLYDDLSAGRWLIVAGERSDAPGVMAAELVMLAAVKQQVDQADDIETSEPDQTPRSLAGVKIHTFLVLAKALAYQYKRDRVTIYGNVVEASNGDTRAEVLGAGAASQAFQQFTLRQPPLTHVSAPTASGTASTLEVRVNEVRWHQADSLAQLGPQERGFVASDDDEGRTTIVFGDGVHGARLPSGIENLRAVYRSGIGKGGNVKAGQVSLLATRPLGVKDVINPIRASGGADKEDREQARKNTPLALMALDRLVSVSDYADFARTFGGIAKAAARRMSNGRRQLLHVTVAGADDMAIDESSDLYRNLLSALHRYGDPYLPLALALRERLALVLSARVRVDPDYLWDLVEPEVRAALLTAFGFERVDLASDLLLAEALRAMQAVPGVAYVDVDMFDTIDEDQVLAGFDGSLAAKLALRRRITLRPAGFEQGRALPAQLAYLSADLPDTLLLTEIAS